MHHKSVEATAAHAFHTCVCTACNRACSVETAVVETAVETAVETCVCILMSIVCGRHMTVNEDMDIVALEGEIVKSLRF